MKQIPLPASMLVMGQRYRVRGESIDGRLGVSDHHAQTIDISPEQATDSQADTLLHESLHALIWVSGASEMFHDGDVEERFVKTIAPVMLDWVRRNPAVYTALTGRKACR